jgi:hypothetical protein
VGGEELERRGKGEGTCEGNYNGGEVCRVVKRMVCDTGGSRGRREKEAE